MRIFVTSAIAFLICTAVAIASVTVGGLTFSVKSVSRASSVGPDLMPQKASGEFIVIRLSLTNVGKDPATISNTDFHLKAGDVTYDASSAGMMAGGFFLEKLNPGVSHTGNIIFDVPASTSPSKYKLVVFGNGNGESREIQL